MHIVHKQMDVQKLGVNRYAYKVYKQIDGCTKSLAILLNRYYAYKVYKQIDGCTKSLAIFTKPLLCI